GGDVVGDRAHGEDRQADVADRYGPPAHGVAAGAQVVVQVQAPQVLGVHAGGHAGRVGVPGHQVVDGPPFAQQVFVDGARPEQVVGAQHLEGARHLVGAEVTPPSHLGLEHVYLGLVD